MRAIIELRKRNLIAEQKQYEENDFINRPKEIHFGVSAINMPFCLRQ